MTKLAIARGLDLPLDAVTQKLAFMGKTGSGKTFAAGKVVEGMLDEGAQVVVIDPVGAWHGLRLPGIGPGYEIPVLGGLHGDIPLEPTGGAVVAELVARRSLSVVLDVSQMTSAEQARFVTDFAVRFFELKKAAPSAVHLVLEECQEMVPQNAQPGEQRMLHAFERMVKLGRNFGIGVSLISQRPQEVNKKALNQTECLFAFQMTGPQERKAMAAWMSDKGVEATLVDALPSLQPGHCFVWSPSWLGISKQFHILPKRSADASSTPKVGAAARAAEKLTPIDLGQLLGEMAETIERTKADDPAALKKRIAELEKQVAARSPSAPTFTPEEWTTLKSVGEGLKFAIAHAEKAQEVFGRFIYALDRVTPAGPPGQRGIAHRDVKPENVILRDVKREEFTFSRGDRPTRGSKKVGAPSPQSPAEAPCGAAAGMRKGVRNLLDTLARHHPVRLSRSALASRAGLAPSGGTFGTYFGELKKAGFLEEGGGLVGATSAGLGAAGVKPGKPMTSAEVLEAWRSALRKGEREMLDAVLAHGRINRDQLGRVVGIAPSGGTFGTYLGVLRKNALVNVDGPLVSVGPALEGTR